jgi:L-alanine-DL-glutamate epimerase-like enolase superfamily enzyme
MANRKSKMQLLLHPLRLELARPFAISRGTKTHQDCVVVELKDEGLSGWGEAAAHPFFGADQQAMLALLEANRGEIEAEKLDDPVAFWEKMKPRFEAQPFALCALDIAAQDLWARRQNLPLYQAWGLEPDPIPLSNLTLGLDSIPELIQQIRQTDWPIYKVKLGGKQDLATMEALRRETSARFRVDANCGWTVAECLELAPRLAELGVEFLEQPLPVEDWKGMAVLKKHCPLPLIADESCRVEEDVIRCADYFHGINVKLAKCGGLTPALRMLQKARGLGLKTMVGCMIESRIGISAIAHLLPLLDYVDMDGAQGLKHRYADGVELDHGRVVWSSLPGTGASLRKDFQKG